VRRIHILWDFYEQSFHAGGTLTKTIGVADEKGWGLVGHARLSETKVLNCFRSLQNLVRCDG